jgi:hypothetical protein
MQEPYNVKNCENQSFNIKNIMSINKLTHNIDLRINKSSIYTRIVQ